MLNSGFNGDIGSEILFAEEGFRPRGKWLKGPDITAVVKDLVGNEDGRDAVETYKRGGPASTVASRHVEPPTAPSQVAEPSVSGSATKSSAPAQDPASASATATGRDAPGTLVPSGVRKPASIEISYENGQPVVRVFATAGDAPTGGDGQKNGSFLKGTAGTITAVAGALTAIVGLMSALKRLRR